MPIYALQAFICQEALYGLVCLIRPAEPHQGITVSPGFGDGDVCSVEDVSGKGCKQYGRCQPTCLRKLGAQIGIISPIHLSRHLSSSDSVFYRFNLDSVPILSVSRRARFPGGVEFFTGGQFLFEKQRFRFLSIRLERTPPQEKLDGKTMPKEFGSAPAERKETIYTGGELDQWIERRGEWRGKIGLKQRLNLCGEPRPKFEGH
ncbi:hypothetical protein C8R43DRAFT_950070 [Mycena crocata]|nr:hypothetical protein C8R43DRAFT_950070 [Mycena crocata]